MNWIEYIENQVPGEPPDPEPLPSPRYHPSADQAGDSTRASLPLSNLADEILLIRARMHRVHWNAHQPDLPLSRLASCVDLFSSFAVRLARSLRDRQKLYRQRLKMPEHRADQMLKAIEVASERQEKVAIRSSKNPEINLIIENPLKLTPLFREAIGPFPYPSGERKLSVPGRPATDLYAVLEGILHKMLTGVPWYHLPHNYPPASTCHRYYSLWLKTGLLHDILLALSMVQFKEENNLHQQFMQEYGEFYTDLHKTPSSSPDEGQKTTLVPLHREISDDSHA